MTVSSVRLSKNIKQFSEIILGYTLEADTAAADDVFLTDTVGDTVAIRFVFWYHLVVLLCRFRAVCDE